MELVATSDQWAAAIFADYRTFFWQENLENLNHEEAFSYDLPINGCSDRAMPDGRPMLVAAGSPGCSIVAEIRRPKAERQGG
jgi:hypothetical protein